MSIFFRCLLFTLIILFHSAENISASPVVKTTQQKQKKSETIYHVVKPHETLFSIAKKYNSNITEIKKWNKLKNDDLKIGQKLIVGNGKNKKLDEPKKVLKEAPKNLKPATERVIKKTEQEIAKPILPVEKKEEVVPVVKQKEKREIIEQGLVTWIDDEMINPDKYYALHASAPMGTIIKITNGINGKSVYVKVVGKLSSRDESQKIKIKISKSAANKLEVLDERFQAELSYTLSP